MREFKVGDKVKFSERMIGESHGPKVIKDDRVYTIERIDDEQTYLDPIKLKELPDNKFNNRELELVFTEITLKDLQFADVLTTRDGNRYVYADGYMYGESDDYFCDCYDLKDKYNNDLTSKGSYETVYDIVKVERKGEVIFERVEETKREMTIEEIEKELGYSIKIVKEVA